MRNSIIHSLAVVEALLFAPLISNAADLDNRLVGEWQGQRDAESKCSFLAWRLTRSADGKFEITFYADPNKTKEANRERGVWWVKGNEYFSQTQGVPTPDGYSYSFLNQNTVRYSVLERDPSVDCKADYQFTDHRIGRH
jgi:hypothetical protein